MKSIKLTQGQVTLVDDEDFIWLNKWKWGVTTKKGQVMRASRSAYYSDGVKRSISMHRLLMGLQLGDKRMVDHINGNPLDNRRNNLRICTNAENLQNRGKNKNNTSGYKGVVWFKKNRKWRAQLGHKNITYHLGYFNTPKKASKAYDKKALELYGEFANLNGED